MFKYVLHDQRAHLNLYVPLTLLEVARPMAGNFSCAHSSVKCARTYTQTPLTVAANGTCATFSLMLPRTLKSQPHLTNYEAHPQHL